MITPNDIKVLYSNGGSTLYEIVAQDDGGAYSQSGWVAVYDPAAKRCALSAYSHCSCYNTWDVLSDAGWDWEGTPAQLNRLAKNKLDPNMPERKVNETDCDYDHLMKVYEQVLVWYKNRRNK